MPKFFDKFKKNYNTSKSMFDGIIQDSDNSGKDKDNLESPFNDGYLDKLAKTDSEDYRSREGFSDDTYNTGLYGSENFVDGLKDGFTNFSDDSDLKSSFFDNDIVNGVGKDDFKISKDNFDNAEKLKDGLKDVFKDDKSFKNPLKGGNPFKKGLSSLFNFGKKTSVSFLSGFKKFTRNVGFLAYNTLSSAAKALSVGMKIFVPSFFVGSASLLFIIFSLLGLNRDDDSYDFIPQDSNCAEEVDQYLANFDGEGMTNAAFEKGQLENARKIYSLFKKLGLPDTNIAGILGNFELEGMVDPTTVEKQSELIKMQEYFTPGIHKSEIFSSKNNYENLHKYGEKVLKSYYGASFNINQSGYVAEDGKVWPGIGMGQFTGPRAKLLVDSADKFNSGKWWELEFQLAHMITVDYKSDWVRNWTKAEPTPEAAATVFNRVWEGNTLANAQRGAYASRWMSKIQEFTLDHSFADSVLAMADVNDSAASNLAQSSALENCSSTSYGVGNGDIVEGAVSITWPYRNESIGNNGTELYRTLFPIIFPGDLQVWGPRSCDRVVATVVRWVGADDEFTPYGCINQMAYLRAHPEKFEYIGTTVSDYDKMQPGDILIRSGHIMIYVGREALDKQFGAGKYEPEGVLVQGSATPGAARSAGVGTWYVNDHQNAGNPYYIFRSIYKEENSIYTGLGLGSGPPIGLHDYAGMM